MGYRVRDEIELSIFINYKEYPLQAVNVLNFLHMGFSTKYKLPTVYFSIVDLTDSIPAMGLTDASPLTIVINCDGVLSTRHFRVHNHKNPPGQKVYIIDGYWDAPRYWAGTAKSAMRGTSSEVIGNIAATCGLAYNGVTTNDSQLWLPRNRTYGSFVSYVAQHGYLDDQSHLLTCVDSTGTLRYQDSRHPKSVFKVVHGYKAQGAYPVSEFVPNNKAGLNNALSGYRDTRVDTSVYGPTVTHDSLAFTPDSKNVLINSDVRDKIQRGAFSYSPIGFGTVHPNFQKAKYQNARFHAIKNLSADLVFNAPTQMEPLDGILYSTNPTTPGEYDGQYALGSKVIYVQGNTYVEKFIAYKEGLS